MKQEFSEVCKFLSETPEKIRLMVNSLTAEEQRSKPSDGGFSVLGNVCHLRDIEERGYLNRIEKILSEDDPFLPDIDGDRLAVERDYQNQNLSEELAVFSRCREDSLLFLEKSSPEDLSRTATLETVGEITLGELLLKMREHDGEHLQAISELCGGNAF